jgi:TolB protein
MRKVLIFLLLLPATLLAQREPVLKQIDLPHPYYYREMYLPQLTSGPSWVTWSPDSKSVIYSMAGSLWRQKIDSTEAVQLTDGPGYDYQPDWSHDGKYVVYTKYDHDALELWLLDVASGKSSQLTKGADVNVEPRWSPDGKRIAYVSTAGTKHFHIFLMEMDGGSPKAIRQLTKENISTLRRYYYSKFDHEISPAWSPDGKDIIFVSNHGHIHGTGGIWRATVPDSGMIDTNTNAKEIHYEETNWKARPEFSPDGKRIVYASYLGRQWHQLWLMPSQGGDVFPLTYGEYDNINPRWSPDGKEIAYVSNGGPDLALFVESHGGGTSAIFPVRTPDPSKQISVRAMGPEQRGVAARFSSPDISFADLPRLHSDDGYDRTKHRREATYFHFDSTIEVTARADDVRATVTRGLDYFPGYEVLHPSHTINETAAKIVLNPVKFTDQENWISGDLHVHMNYGGNYESPSLKLAQEMDAENLDVVMNLIVNKEQRFPDAGEIEKLGPPAERFELSSSPHQFFISTAQEFHTSYWGHLGLLNTRHLILPGYAGYPNTAAASLVPMDADVADMAHAQNKDALVGWVHPFDELPDPYKDAKLTNELPIDVALGKVDYYEVLGFSDHKSSAAIWYRLLNLGFHLPAGAGTDAMTNFASLRGPVGLNRVYVNVSPGPLKVDEWLKNLKAGKTFATNGPLLRFTLGGQPIGGEVKLEKPGDVRFMAALRSIVPLDKVEVVCNGAVVKSIFPVNQRSAATQAKTNARSFAGAQDDKHANDGGTKDSQGHAATTSLDVSGTVPIGKSGWCVLRAYSDHAEEPIMDIYPYGTTSPIYVTVAGVKPRSPEDAKFFSKWIERVREDASVHPDYNTPQEREHVLKVLDDASKVYAGMQ